MADNQDDEPSIEEILASIRQIIDEDEEDEVDLEESDGNSEDDLLELSEEDFDEPEEDTFDVLAEDESEDDFVEEPAPETEPVMAAPDPEPEEPEAEDSEPDEFEQMLEMRERAEERLNNSRREPDDTVPSDILSSRAQTAALGSLSKLKSQMPINSPRSYDGVTLEDIVRQMLHPMLRDWMDENLPPMVERIVQKELEKLARRALDD